MIRFNFSVRNGKRWNPYAVITLISFLPPSLSRDRRYALGNRTTEASRTQFITLLNNQLSKATGLFSSDPLPHSGEILFTGMFRAISTARLHGSPRLHLRPIDVVVCDGPLARSNLGDGFVLRCFQHLSKPDAATRRCPSAGQPAHRRSVQHGPLVLVPDLRKSQRPQQIETELSHDVLNPARVPL